MKGLILKDLYMLWRYCKLIFIFMLACGVIMTLSGNTTMGIFLCMLMALLSSTIQAYDEREKWTQYSATLPYTRDQIVSVKFIISLTLSGIWIVFFAILLTVNSVFMETENPLSAGQIALICSISLLVCSFTSLCMPFVFKLGAEKGRYVYMIFGALSGATSMVLATTIEINSSFFPSPEQPSMVICAILTALSVLLYAISWRLSILFYRKREL